MTTDIDLLPLLAVGGGVAALAAVARARATLERDLSEHPPAIATAGGGHDAQDAWVYPVPSLGDRVASTSDGFDSPRTLPDGSRGKHLGVDLMFRRRDARDLISVYIPGTPSGTKGYFMPDGVPALAASAGVVRLSQWTPLGYSVVIRHPNGWATYYTHLASLSVVVGAAVAAGDPIGVIGASPADHEHVRHLHFELWQLGTRAGAVDPAPYLTAWPRKMIASWSPGAPIPLRNGTLTYRPVGDRGEPYPEWLRRLRGASGVYVIRERSGPIVYVGSSSAGRLYETLTRHFQTWRRWKRFWKGYVEGHDPGLTYERASVEVATLVTAPGEALAEESRLIARLQPRDNVIGQPELEDAPF